MATTLKAHAAYLLDQGWQVYEGRLFSPSGFEAKGLLPAFRGQRDLPATLVTEMEKLSKPDRHGKRSVPVGTLLYRPAG